MDYRTTFRKAKEMDKNRLAAARIRMRFIDQELELLFAHPPHDIVNFWIAEYLFEKSMLVKHAYYEEVPVAKGSNDITEDMIARAREYPIESLIDFQRGVSYAFCHDDRRPSLSLYRPKNNCRCFVCNKSFNPIDVLMIRDGMSFADAVRSLT